MTQSVSSFSTHSSPHSSQNKDSSSVPSSDSFASLFEESLSTGHFHREGEIVQGTVLGFQRDHVVVDIGGKSEGVIPLSEFSDETERTNLKIGGTVDVFVENYEDENGHVILSKEKAEKIKVWDEIALSCEESNLIEGTIYQRVKGGLAVTVRGGVKAFLPGSQVDLRPVRNLDKLLGQTFSFAVIKFNKKRGNIVLSRRALLEKERDEFKAKTLENLEENTIVHGTIKNITDYGAFVDLGGIDGLLHITDMSWGRVNHPSEMFKIGDPVTVKILKYNQDKERVSLGLKQTLEDPWVQAESNYWSGKKVQGKVLSLTDYGAFVELQSGIEGLIHLSEMSWSKKFKHPSAYLEIGQEIACQVLELDVQSKRISLGLKQLEPNPWILFTEKYKPGDKVTGKIRSLTDYGLFIGLEEGIDGMVHKSDISWTVRVNHPGDMYQKGDEVLAIILSINHDEKKIALGLRQVFDDPWQSDLPCFSTGAHVSGSVLSVLNHGVFVRIQPGVEAFIPSNKLPEGVSLQVGEILEARVFDVDAHERFLKLSMQPQDDTLKEEAPRVERPVRKPVEDKAQIPGSIGELIKEKLGSTFHLVDQEDSGPNV